MNTHTYTHTWNGYTSTCLLSDLMEKEYTYVEWSLRLSVIYSPLLHLIDVKDRHHFVAMALCWCHFGKIPELMAGRSVTLVAMALPFDFQYGFPLSSSTNVNIGIHFRKHYFINTRKIPCVEEKNYLECGKKCIEKIFDKNRC
uniref:Uncharacterized protein n=1 Tax=Strigamia maritima TaxID=126957 RepID=T1JI43_STRMM